MRIVWDEPKRLANLTKHGLDFGDLTFAFFAAAVIRQAKARRFKAIGRLQNETVAVIAAPLGSEGVSVISMRPASLKEKRLLC